MNSPVWMVVVNYCDNTDAATETVQAIERAGGHAHAIQGDNAMIELLKNGIIEIPKIINIGSVSVYTSSPDRGEYCFRRL